MEPQTAFSGVAMPVKGIVIVEVLEFGRRTTVCVVMALPHRPPEYDIGLNNVKVSSGLMGANTRAQRTMDSRRPMS